MLSDTPRQKLAAMIALDGIKVASDAKLCEALLRDYCGEYRLEIAALSAAVRWGIPKSLSEPGLTPPATLRASLARRLQENHGLAEDSAYWAVDAWASVLAQTAGGNAGYDPEGVLNTTRSMPVAQSPYAPPLPTPPSGPQAAPPARPPQPAQSPMLPPLPVTPSGAQPSVAKPYQPPPPPPVQHQAPFAPPISPAKASYQPPPLPKPPSEAPQPNPQAKSPYQPPPLPQSPIAPASPAYQRPAPLQVQSPFQPPASPAYQPPAPPQAQSPHQSPSPVAPASPAYQPPSPPQVQSPYQPPSPIVPTKPPYQPPAPPQVQSPYQPPSPIGPARPPYQPPAPQQAQPSYQLPSPFQPAVVTPQPTPTPPIIAAAAQAFESRQRTPELLQVQTYLKAEVLRRKSAPLVEELRSAGVQPLTAKRMVSQALRVDAVAKFGIALAVAVCSLVMAGGVRSLFGSEVGGVGYLIFTAAIVYLLYRGIRLIATF